MSKSCRICDSVLSRTHYVALFSRESLASDLANRLSKVADVPVASEDGLSRFICISCKKKLMSGEYFRTTAKATYTTPNLYVSVRLETYGNTVLIVLGNFLCISLSRKDTKTCSKFS